MADLFDKFLEISKLDDELLYVNSLTGGLGSNDIGLDRGQLGSKGRVVYFHKVGKKILLIDRFVDSTLAYLFVFKSVFPVALLQSKNIMVGTNFIF